MKPLRVCLVGFSPLTNLSYGNIIRKLAERLHGTTVVLDVPEKEERWSPTDRERSLEIITIGTGVDARVHPWPDWKHYHNEALDEQDRGDGYATFVKYYNEIQPDIVILVNDAYTMHRWAGSALRDKFSLVMYSPVDAVPYHFKKVLFDADYLVYYTEESRKAIGAELPYSIIPAGVDADKYKPLPNREELRKKVFGDTDLALLFVGTNQLRKQNWQLLEVVGRAVNGKYLLCDKCGVLPQSFHRRTTAAILNGALEFEGPDKCPFCGSELSYGNKLDLKLWLHTPISTTPLPYEWNLPFLTEMYEALPAVFHNINYRSPSSSISEESLNALYNAADILFYITGGEGFGMPVLEAAFAGTPIIYSDWSVLAEIMKENNIPGFGVNVTVLQPKNNDSVLRGLIDPFDAINILRKLDKKTLRKMRRDLLDMRDTLVEKYSWDNIAEQWREVIARAATKKKTEKGPILL